MLRVAVPSDAKQVSNHLHLLHLANLIKDYAINNNLTPFISMQNYHSLLYREEEREMLPVCKVSSFL
jgi:aryl-alcohol dehydrogenase-like predicted oxidoreductase